MNDLVWIYKTQELRITLDEKPLQGIRRLRRLTIHMHPYPAELMIVPWTTSFRRCIDVMRAPRKNRQPNPIANHCHCQDPQNSPANCAKAIAPSVNSFIVRLIYSRAQRPCGACASPDGTGAFAVVLSRAIPSRAAPRSESSRSASS